jgi:hypothetical protein
LIFFTQALSTTVFGFTVRLFAFGRLAVSSLSLAVAFSFGCQPTTITAVTLSAPAGPANIKNKLAPTTVDLT